MANRSTSQISTKVDPSAMGNLALFLKTTRMNKVISENGYKLNFNERRCDTELVRVSEINVGNPLLAAIS